MRTFFEETEAKGYIGLLYFVYRNIFPFLDPKEAFFGGRTCVHQIFAEADAHYEIIYMDIISLYPFVNYQLKYPVNVPEIIHPELMNVDWTKPEEIVHDGLYKVRVIPPKNVFLPVLPMRVNKDDPRLMFMLCNKCANKNSKGKQIINGAIKCNHSDAERGWTSTMTSIELRVALSEGYKITHCYRIWKYKEFDNLFKEYVQRFMKMKIESSGFPSTVETLEQKMEWKNGLNIYYYLSKYVSFRLL